MGSAPEAEPVKGKDAWPEPPMPRDSHLLPEVSQQLLRAARAGRLYKPAEPANDDDKENADEEKETKETQKGFAARKWTQVPRHLEEPEREYLAKRRKGLPSAYANLSGLIGPLVQTGEMRKTKVKKTDAAGNVHIYEVLVEPGKTLENEVVETEPAAAQPAEVAVPGTVVEGVGIVNADGLVVASDIIQPTPPRRRPPPPRRKPKKGPGRGRKRVVFEPGTEGARGSLGSNQITSAGTQAATTAGESTSGVPSTGSDTPMADAGNEEGSGEDGDESDESEDDNDREEGELSDDAPPSPARQPASAPTPPPVQQPAPAGVSSPLTPIQFTKRPSDSVTPAIIVDHHVDREPSSSPDLPLAAVSHSRQGSLTRPPGSGASPPKEKDGDATFSDGEVDLFGSLERHLEKESQSANGA